MITSKWFNGYSEDAYYVRNKVFVEEQHCNKKNEIDVYDEQCMNLVIYCEEKPVATGRIFHDGKTFRLGRVCVLKEYRGQHIGDLLMRMLIIKVFTFLPSVVNIHSQTSVKRFYEKYGFKVVSQTFLDENIEHVEMSVTKESVILKSKCGKDINVGDFR